MNLASIQARIVRLHELAEGLSKEVKLVRDGETPLTPLEQKLYLRGVQDALAAVEEARRTLVTVLPRLEKRRDPF